MGGVPGVARRARVERGEERRSLPTAARPSMDRKQKTRSPPGRKPLHNPGESVQAERTRLMEEEFVPAMMLPLVTVVVAVREWGTWYFHWPRQPGVLSLVALGFVGYECTRS